MDIEGELIDTKSYDFPSSTHGTIRQGTPVHHMQVRITINESLEIVDAAAVTLHGPYAICPKGAENITGLIGLKIGAGWKHKVKTAIGGAHGCTHITELLGPVATIAYQTLYGHDARERRQRTHFSDADKQSERSHLRNSCVGYADDLG